MEKGDISNVEASRVVFVFEHTIGYLPDKATAAKEKALCAARSWRRAVDCWEIPEHVHALLWDLTWRYDCKFDAVTFKPAKFGVALHERLKEENLPFANLWADTPSSFAHRLTFLPSVMAVYDAEISRQFTYGGKGVHVPGGLAVAGALW